MSTDGVQPEAFGSCARGACEEPCPWDMAAIVFDAETVCCSPACAETVLEGLETAPETVTLHDPQFAVDREPLGVGGDVVDFVHEADGKPEVEEAIREAAMLHEPRFRAGGDPGMECHNCGDTHTDWSKDGEYAVDDGHHAGIIERYRCGHCDAITEGGRR